MTIKLFGRWDFEGIEVRDEGLKEYINLVPVHIPATGARQAKKRFGRRKYNIVERLTNKIMITGHIKASKKHFFTSGRNSGKKLMALDTVEKAFDYIQHKTKANPIQVLVRAVEYSAPRAEVTTVEFGGIRTPVAVDTAPIRRVDLALSFLTKGAAQKSNRSKKPIHEALAEELIAASNNDPKSFSAERKTTMEKQSEASR